MNHEPDGTPCYHSTRDRVPANHPLRLVKEIANRALKRLSGSLSSTGIPPGWPSIPPEKLLRALLLQVLYSIPNERLLMEQLDYNLLFRWFVGLSMDEEVWDQSLFLKDRDRLAKTDIVRRFFAVIREETQRKELLRDEHFEVDWALVETWVSRDTPPTKKNESRDLSIAVI